LRFINPSVTGGVKLNSFYKGDDLKKPSGGKKRRVRKTKKKALGGGPPQIPKLGENDVRYVERVRGGNKKVRLREARYANVYVPKERKHVKAKILSIVSTPANPDFAKRNLIVKGAIIQTEIGKAVVTSRPGQDGVINAVLIE
jgi:small subunit ribosomal protein S8e